MPTGADKLPSGIMPMEADKVLAKIARVDGQKQQHLTHISSRGGQTQSHNAGKNGQDSGGRNADR